MYSHFFILNERGDVVASREYRRFDLPTPVAEDFWNCILAAEDRSVLPPVVRSKQMNYMFLRKHHLFFVLGSTSNLSPSMTIELLKRIFVVCRDFTGQLSEESLRRNFVLLYELLDEIMDYGYPQITSTTKLKVHTFNEPVELGSVGSFLENLGVTMGDVRVQSSSSAIRPVAVGMDQDRKRRNEIFVDLLEHHDVTTTAEGEVVRAQLHGAMVIRNFLKGEPELRITLNNNLFVEEWFSEAPAEMIRLEHINFHECCRIDTFERDKTLVLRPPDGEFTLFSYRFGDSFSPPFRIHPHLEVITPTTADLFIKVHANFPESRHATTVTIKFPLPDQVDSVSFNIDNNLSPQEAEPKHEIMRSRHDKTVSWTVSSVLGDEYHTLQAKLNFLEEVPNLKWRLSPLCVSYEIAMFLSSRMEIKNFKIVERSDNYEPYKWIRYLSRAKSFEVRL